MRKLLLTVFICFIFLQSFSQQKIISDLTVTFAVTNTDASAKNDLSSASKIIYLRGKQLRVDLNSNTFNQSIFYNENTGEATVLKSIGDSKYISNYSAQQWKNENSVYDGLKISYTGNTKKILNYDCKEAILELKNGTKYSVYYVPDIMPSVTENDFQFKTVPGLVLQYQTTIRNEKVEYTATKINFDPVPAFHFEIPKSGYKVLN